MSRFYVPGIPDEEFLRERVPMTKREVRVLSVSAMRLSKNSVVADIGAGTGSVSIECALIAPEGRVYAFEKNPEAVALIERNCNHFGVSNIEVIAGNAGAQLSTVDDVLDAMFIGGSGGEMESVLKTGYKKLRSGGRVVINAVNIETLTLGLNTLKKCGYSDISFIQASISRSRKLGKGHALEPLNPVFIIEGSKS